MLHRLKRHPFPVVAHFDWCLVLTYALPSQSLTPLLPPGLTLDTHNNYGFVACALVQTRALRPAGFPHFLGKDFFLAGFRIFARYRRPDPSGSAATTLRGLKILRSLTDKPTMAFSGNLLTHYNYAVAQTQIQSSPHTLSIQTSCKNLGISLDVSADLSTPDAPLPQNSVFQNLQEARKFQGPMPFTFDYEPQTQSIIVIKGTRQSWSPRPVRATVHQNTFFDSLNLQHAPPILSSVFYTSHVDYRWEVGRRHRLSSANSPATPDTRVIDDE